MESKTEVTQFRLTALKPIGRTKKQSVVASAAYISRSKLKDDELEKVFDYRSKNKNSKVLSVKIHAPNNVPDWVYDAEKFCNNIQKREHHKNAQFARSLQINLPHQLSLNAMESLLDEYVLENFTNEDMVAFVALHEPDKNGDPRNFHAHILLTLRRIDHSGFTGNKVRTWNSKTQLLKWRENLALVCSKKLEDAGHYALAARWKFGHLTLDAQRKQAIERGDMDYIDACYKVPSKHKGVQIHHMEKRGIISKVELRREEERLVKCRVDADYLTKFQHLLPKNTRIGDFIDETMRKQIEDAHELTAQFLKERERDEGYWNDRIREK